MNPSMLKEVFEAELSRRGIPFFVSGSVRFGYHTDKSDLDFVIDASDAEKVQGLISDTDGIRPPTPGYSHALAEIKFFGEKVHVSIKFDSKEFLDLEAEHIQVEKFLKKNPYLISFIRQMKRSVYLKKISTGIGFSAELSGCDIYNIVKVIMAEEAPQLEIEQREKDRNRFLRPQI